MEFLTDWTSQSASTPVVRYGTKRGIYTHYATGTSRTYGASDMCRLPANITAQVYFRDPGWIHDVLLDNLEPDTLYYYIFGSYADGLWSEEFSFYSPPAVGPSTGVKMIAFGMNPYARSIFIYFSCIPEE